MIYRVLWTAEAEAQFVRVWAGSRRRERLQEAVRQIDDLLASRPTEIGESRPDGMRIAFAEPVAVVYRIESAGATVRVVAMWEF